jgi:hypothetical protein
MGDRVIIRNRETTRTVYRDRPVYVDRPSYSSSSSSSSGDLGEGCAAVVVGIIFVAVIFVVLGSIVAFLGSLVS